MAESTGEDRAVPVDKPNCSDACSHAHGSQGRRLTFAFYANDHDPPHVHAYRGGGKCKIVISTLEIVDRGMKPADMMQAATIVQKHSGELLDAWNRFQARKRDA